MSEDKIDEDLRIVREIVAKASEAFGEHSMFHVGQALSALLGLYFHRLDSDLSRMAVGKLIIDGAVDTSRRMDEDDRRGRLH